MRSAKCIYVTKTEPKLISLPSVETSLIRAKVAPLLLKRANMASETTFAFLVECPITLEQVKEATRGKNRVALLLPRRSGKSTFVQSQNGIWDMKPLLDEPTISELIARTDPFVAVLTPRGPNFVEELIKAEIEFVTFVDILRESEERPAWKTKA